MIHIYKKKKMTLLNVIRIYQYADGTYLPDSSQPKDTNKWDFNIGVYTPHKSTRYINVETGNNGIAKFEDNNGSLVETVMVLPELYTSRVNCCGCSACFSICSRKAIIMRPCEEGFLYPVVDAKKCVRCYRCLAVCPIKDEHEDHIK